MPVAVCPSKQLHAALIVLFKRGKITFYFVRSQSCALQRAAEYLRVCALAVFVVLRHLRIQRGNLCGLLLGLFDRVALHGRILSMHRVHCALIVLLIAAVLHLDVLHRRLIVFVAPHARSRFFVRPFIGRFLRIRCFEHFPARFSKSVQQLAQLGDFVICDRAIAGHQRGHIIGHGLRLLCQPAFQRIGLRVQFA